MLLEIPLFILVILFVFFLPGRWALRALKFPLTDMLSLAGFSLAIGLSCFLIGEYALSWIHVPFIYNFFLLFVAMVELKPSYQEWKKQFHVRQLISLPALLILLGSTGMVFLVAPSGIISQGEMPFYGVNAVDSVYHLSLISSMMQHFPPSNPSLSGVPLRGYHILYDFLQAQLNSLYGFNRFDMFFRLFPVFLSLFYGLCGLVLARYLKFDKLQQAFFLFLLYFGQGSQFFLTNFLPGAYDPGIVQSIAHIFDPSVVLSMGIFFLFAPLVGVAKKGNHLLFAVLLLGVLGGLKVYTAILCFAGFGVIALLRAIRERKYDYILFFTLAGFISAAFFIPFNFGVGKLIFAPLLLFRHFMESNQIFVFLAWPLKMQVYEQHHSVARIGQLYVEAILLFFIPSLGVRLLSLLGLKSILKKGFYTSANIFLMVSATAGLILGSFFIQSIEVFNTIQFLWLVYIILIVPTAFVLGSFAKRSRWASIALWVIVIVICLPDTFLIVKSYTRPSIVLSKNFVISMKKLEAITVPQDAIIVIDRIDKKDIYNTTFFSAISSRLVYYQPLVIDNVGLPIAAHRRTVVDTLWDLGNSCDSKTALSILHKEDIKYMVTVVKQPCWQHEKNLEQVATYGDYQLFRVI